MNTRHGRGLDEEIFDDFGHEAAFLGLGGFADDGGKIQFAFGEPFQRGIGDAFQSLRVHLLDDALLDEFFVDLVVRIHIANHFLQLIGGEHVAQDIEHLAGALRVEVVFDGLDALKQFVEHAAFARVRRNKIENEAVLLLAVTVDAAHALFKPDRIPRNVVVDHQPAELKVDAFAGGLGRDEHLGGLREIPLGEDAGAGRVAVANFHAAMNLRHGQSPFAQFAERASVFAVASTENRACPCVR